MADYKQLCFELTEALCGYEVTDEDIALIDRARAELAKPEPKPEGPTDEELMKLAREWNSGYESIELEFIADYARAVLARWGK